MRPLRGYLAPLVTAFGASLISFRRKITREKTGAKNTGFLFTFNPFGLIVKKLGFLVAQQSAPTEFMNNTHFGLKPIL
ncbi:MAG: hypothetical protein DRR08_16130 [Candidatus Parabeggiatoa sp. nov. 2]|nr:MAG: hypothetical protein B6247_31695 [Beggiatoa sp. 4572_84]RKZ58573.1 MAG: hypothetical protein DRR08_16130 [Gammaproteobacteria bacterium]